MDSKKLIIISDLHIGGDEIIEDFNCENELIEFLDHLEKTNDDLELIILGDFFDLWKVESNPDDQVGFIINKRKNLFNRLKSFGEKFPITVIAGNHDHALAYNKKYQEDLRKYNIHVDTNQFFKREFFKKGKIFRIIGEHGNQAEPGCAFPDFNMPTDSSLAYHLANLFVYKVMRLGNKKKRPLWVKDLDNVDNDLIPYWFLSKYFYYELGPILRAIMIPMLILFGFALPYFIFDLVTEFYHPSFLEPVLLLLDTNTFFKVIIFILYFDMVVVIILFFASLIRKDFKRRLHEYGMQSLSEVLLSRKNNYLQHAKEVIKGKNPYTKEAHLYVNGHTHMPDLIKNIQDGNVYVDTGSWKQLMKRMTARFRFPSIFVPYYSLTYLLCDHNKGDTMHIQLRQWPKHFVPKLTILERLTIRKRRGIPKPVKSDYLINEVQVPFK